MYVKTYIELTPVLAICFADKNFNGYELFFILSLSSIIKYIIEIDSIEISTHSICSQVYMTIIAPFVSLESS